MGSSSPATWKFDLPALSGFEEWEIEVPSQPAITPEELLWALRDRLARAAPRRLKESDELIEEGDEIECLLLPMFEGRLLTSSLVVSSCLVVHEVPSLPGLMTALRGSSPHQIYEFELQMPSDYPLDELAGKFLSVIAKIGEVRAVELPELDSPQALEAVGLSPDLDEAMAQIAADLEEQREEELLSLSSRCVLERLAESVDIKLPSQVLTNELDQIFQQTYLPLLQQVDLSESELALAQRCFLEDPQAQLEAEYRVRSSLALQAVRQTHGLEVSEELLEQLEDNTAEALSLPVEQFCEILDDEPLLDDKLGALAERLTALEFVCSKVQFTFPDEPEDPQSELPNQ